MKENKKLRIGIDVNEVLRARWLQFDKFYVQEFGEEGIPEREPYVYDLYENYKWEDKKEEINILNEDLPEDINPLDYQIDNETGEAPVDHMAFKKEKKELTAREIYNRFMFEDFLFEIHGSAPIMYKQMDLHVEKFYKKYNDFADFTILSEENWFSIPPTLFFLSKIMSRFKNYRFVEEKSEMWNDIDILITTDPEILDGKIPQGKKVIKLSRPYNKDSKKGIIEDEILQINDLIDNDQFKNIIGYKEENKENE